MNKESRGRARAPSDASAEDRILDRLASMLSLRKATPGSAAAEGVSGRRARELFAERLQAGRRCMSRSRCRASAQRHTLCMSCLMLDRYMRSAALPAVPGPRSAAMGWRMMRGEEGRWNGCCLVGDRNSASGGGALGTLRPLEGGLGSRFSDEAMLTLAACGERMYKFDGQQCRPGQHALVFHPCSSSG